MTGETVNHYVKIGDIELVLHIGEFHWRVGITLSTPQPPQGSEPGAPAFVQEPVGRGIFPVAHYPPPPHSPAE